MDRRFIIGQSRKTLTYCSNLRTSRLDTLQKNLKLFKNCKIGTTKYISLLHQQSPVGSVCTTRKPLHISSHERPSILHVHSPGISLMLCPCQVREKVNHVPGFRKSDALLKTSPVDNHQRLRNNEPTSQNLKQIHAGSARKRALARRQWFTFCLACVHPTRDARGQLGEYEDSVTDARGAAESISSYLSDLPTIQVHPELDGRTLDIVHCFYNIAGHFSR